MKQRKGLTTHGMSELKETSSWATVGPATDKHQAPTQRLKVYVTAVIKSEAWPTVVVKEIKFEAYLWDKLRILSLSQARLVNSSCALMFTRTCIFSAQREDNYLNAVYDMESRDNVDNTQSSSETYDHINDKQPDDDYYQMDIGVRIF